MRELCIYSIKSVIKIILTFEHFIVTCFILNFEYFIMTGSEHGITSDGFFELETLPK